MTRSIGMQKRADSDLRFFEDRRYGILDSDTVGDGAVLVPKGIPPPMNPLPTGITINQAHTAPHPAQWAFQSTTAARPNLNPMRLNQCRVVPPTHRALGHCGHPGCRRIADIQGLNRLCDGCGEDDPECELFYCVWCLN